MANILYSATDREGKAVQGIVDAPGVAEARSRLVAQGFADVVLHQEANISVSDRDVAGLSPAQVNELAALRIRLLQKPGLASVFKEVARANRGWIAFDIAMCAWGLWSGRMWLAATGAVLAVYPFAFAAWKFRHADRYRDLLKAYAVGEWDRVRDLARKLRQVSHVSETMDFDLDVRLASIDAREGKLEQAVASLEPWRARLAAKPGLFEARLASVHSAAQDRAAFVRLMAQARELSPEPARSLDCALAQARFGDADRARELLASVDASLLPPHAQGFVTWTTGLVQMRLREAGALENLGAAVAAFLKLSANQPAGWTGLALCTCDHAVALALAGRKDEARRELAQVWPIVQAHGDAPLIRMLEADGLAPH